MFNPSISKATTMTLSLVLPLLVVGLLLLGLPALTEARELDPPPPPPAVDALSPQLQSTVGATFTYQGRLLQGTDAVSGTCNLTFKLFDSLSGGSQVGSDVTNSSIAVQDGYFTQALNFGDTAFDGDARWLEITINSCNGGGSSATLNPRVALQAAPYALYALNGGGSGWALTGNSGTGTTNFVGTTDNMTLTLKVNNQTGLRLMPGGAAGDEAPNIIGGGEGNVISATRRGSVIGGGGRNQITANLATVGGGQYNEATANYATVPGGRAAQASHWGEMAYAGGRFSVPGDAQTSVYVLRNFTTNGTATELFLDGTGERLTIADERVVTFDILVVAVRLNSGTSAGYHYSGVIENIDGTTSLLGVTSLMEYEDQDWDVAVEADDTNDALVINVTGPNNPVRWVATVRTVEVGSVRVW